MTTPQGNMTLELYEKILSQLPQQTVVVPFFRGESTLHPQFSRFMRRLGRFEEVQFACNGDNLTPRNRKAILDYCTFFSYSLHEFKFPHQTRILTFLYDLLGTGTKTQVSILEPLVPKERKERFVHEWLQHVDRVRIYKMHSQKGFGHVQGNPIKKALPCRKPFEETVVYWNGEVGLCNHDWNNLTELGDLNRHTLDFVWQSAPYVKVRQQHLGGERRQVKSCENCSFWQTGYLPRKMFGELHIN